MEKLLIFVFSEFIKINKKLKSFALNHLSLVKYILNKKLPFIF